MATSKPYVQHAIGLLQAARPGGLARQEVLAAAAPHVRMQQASIFGPFLAHVPANEQALRDRSFAIVAVEMDKLVERGQVVHSQADDMLYWQDCGTAIVRYVACADVVDDVPGLERGVLEGIPELAASINHQGLLVPILVATTGDGVYHLGAGHRRLAAHGHLGASHILARIWHTDEAGLADAVRLLRAHENLWSQPLTPSELAEADVVARAGELKALASVRKTQAGRYGKRGGQPTHSNGVTKGRRQDNSKRAAQQLAKERGITVKAAREAIALATLEDRLEARTKRKRVPTDPKGYEPNTLVMLVAMHHLTKLQGAVPEERAAVCKEALKGLRAAEAEDLARWQAETKGGTVPTAAALAKAKERQDNSDSDAARAALLAARGRDLHAIARKLNITPQRTEELIVVGQRLLACPQCPEHCPPAEDKDA